MTKNIIARAAVLVVATAAASAAVPPTYAQSLGDLARQEAARRQAVKGPVKVFTNESLPPGPQAVVPPSAEAPGAQPAPPAASAPADAAATPEKEPQAPDPTKDPEYWRKRMADAKQARDRNAFLLQAVQSRINALTTDFYARDDPYQRDQIGLERQKTLAELDRMKKEQVALEKQVADIEEEARRANIPPGWLR